MTPKIIYMTNIDRRYFMMRRALDELIADGEMTASSQVVDGGWLCVERIVGRKTTRERTGHDPFHGKYDPYEVLDGVYAFSARKGSRITWMRLDRQRRSA